MSYARTLIFLALLLSGCSAFRYPTGITLAEREVLANFQAPKPTVGVQEPRIHLDAKQPLAESEFWTYETRGAIDRATYLIHSLRGTGLFEQVDFLCQLSSAPDIVIEPRTGPPGSGDPEAFWPWFITFGLFPWTATEQKGVYFARQDREQAEVRFDWPETFVIGWFAVPLHLSPNWHLERSSQAFQQSLASHLLTSNSDLWKKDTWLTREDAGRLTRHCS